MFVVFWLGFFTFGSPSCHQPLSVPILPHGPYRLCNDIELFLAIDHLALILFLVRYTTLVIAKILLLTLAIISIFEFSHFFIVKHPVVWGSATKQVQNHC